MILFFVYVYTQAKYLNAFKLRFVSWPLGQKKTLNLQLVFQNANFFPKFTD